MKKYIVITSVFEPTQAISAFSRLTDYRVVVVGDKKTPANWSCPGVEYLSVENQQNEGARLGKLLPYNHYSRKMLGYICAMKHSADIIVDSDDDNIPKSHWEFPSVDGDFDLLTTGKRFTNIYRHYAGKNIWPRGFPLQMLMDNSHEEIKIKKQFCRVGVWQGLADENPDVDAVYRLTINDPCIFNEKGPVVLAKNTLCPYNSQNTLTRKELFPLLYLPAFASFRFTDILRGLVAQPIMWLYGYQLGFTNATTIQKRNFHDYFEDFVSEIPMYTHSAVVADIVGSAISEKHTIGINLYKAYEELEKNKIVVAEELKVLEAWLEELESLRI
jgi:hypothetical protein